VSGVSHGHYICTTCKKVVPSRPPHRCMDCGGGFRPAGPDDLACDRCGEREGRRLFDRTGEYDRLCPSCIDEVVR
jgi:DNA-directed RNA polymerase subunit RPC12/RpoP